MEMCQYFYAICLKSIIFFMLLVAGICREKSVYQDEQAKLSGAGCLK